MVGCAAFFLIAKQARTWQVAVEAHSILECLECEMEVVNFRTQDPFFLALLDTIGPKSAIDVNKLIGLERNQAS